MPNGKSERTVAECLECGAGYAAKAWTDGTIQPIGARDGCQCGSTEFRVLEEPTGAVLQEEASD